MSIQSDTYLLKSGDTAAFERLFQYYSRSMFYVAMGLVEDRQIAEDAVQERFINLWAHREQINPDYDLQYYLNQSVRNYIYKYFRHCRVREKHAEALIREYKFWADYKSEDLAEKVENVRELLLSLPENCRKIFVMAVIEGTGYAETASKLNVSVNTVKSQVKIAYRKLKGMWGISENELLLFLIFIYLKKF